MAIATAESKQEAAKTDGLLCVFGMVWRLNKFKKKTKRAKKKKKTKQNPKQTKKQYYGVSITTGEGLWEMGCRKVS